jgi:hypothetical protein
MKRTRLIGCKLLTLGVAILSLIALAECTPNSALAQTQKTFILDFDTSSPILALGQSIPLTQTTGVVTAYFSSPSDPATFSIQSYDTTFISLSQFSGKYLYENNTSRDILDIKFNVDLTGINFTFATIELQGVQVDQTSNILLTAYKDTALVGSITAYGSFSKDSYPQGTLSYSSGQPFNWVRISVPAQASGTTDFFVDNIVITFISESSPSPTLSPTATLSLCARASFLFELLVDDHSRDNFSNSLS